MSDYDCNVRTFYHSVIRCTQRTSIENDSLLKAGKVNRNL